ncbi:MAG: hypothetical protein ABR498_07340 [Candidatus Dormibacteria bacterium]
MGFFDKKVQQAQQQAAQQQQSATQQGMGGTGGYNPADAMRQMGMDPNAAMAGAMSADMGAMMAEQQRQQRIQANGVEGKGKIVSAQNNGVDMSTGGQATNYQFQIQVTDGPGAGSTISVAQGIVGDAGWVQPGSTVTLKVNSQNPSEALIFGAG